MFRYARTDEIKKEKDKEKRKILLKQLNKEIYDLKQDLLDDKLSHSDEKYHAWIKKNRPLFFPEKIHKDKNISYDLKCQPLAYLQYALYLNQKIEEFKKRPYQVIPQRNSLIPCHIILNTCGMVGIIGNQKEFFHHTRTELQNDSKKFGRLVWGQVLKLEKKIFRQKNYSFYHQIQTDGISCSLLFILNKYKNKKFGQKINKKKPVIDPAEEPDEFVALNRLTKEECNHYLSGNYKNVGNDPGKNRILSIIDQQGTHFQYSSVRRRDETYTKRSRQIIEQQKYTEGIGDKEHPLSSHSCRTLDPDHYQDFIRAKDQVSNVVISFYEDPLFRKLSLRRYVKTHQSESLLLNEIEAKFLTPSEIKSGKKLIIFYGDWSRSDQMRGCLPTPNLGLKRLLATRFIILDVDEYNTSKLYNVTGELLKKVKIRRGHHQHELHEILTPQEEKTPRIFLNRDVNASKNMLYLGETYLECQERPENFCHKKKDKAVK
jgi:hypothetical protein